MFLSRIYRNALSLLCVVPSGQLSWGLGTCSRQWLPCRMLVTRQVIRGPCSPLCQLLGLPHSMVAGFPEQVSTEDQVEAQSTLWLCLRSHNTLLQPSVPSIGWSCHKGPPDSIWGKMASISWWGVGKVKILKASIIPCGLGNIVVATFGETQSDTHANRDRMHSNPSLRG